MLKLRVEQDSVLSGVDNVTGKVRGNLLQNRCSIGVFVRAQEK